MFAWNEDAGYEGGLNQFLSIFKMASQHASLHVRKQRQSTRLIVVFIDLKFVKYKTDEDKKLHTRPKVRVIVILTRPMVHFTRF